MFNRRHYGFTLIEMVIAIVIVSVGLAGVLTAFNWTVKSSGDPLIHKQMLAVAEEMMEEILLKPYAGAGTITGCDRHLAEGVSDYATYTNQPVCDIDGNGSGGPGTSVAGLSGYTVSVSVVVATLGAPAVAAKKVTVSVTYGGETLSLVGWRTDYAS